MTVLLGRLLLIVLCPDLQGAFLLANLSLLFRSAVEEILMYCAADGAKFLTWTKQPCAPETVQTGPGCLRYCLQQ